MMRRAPVLAGALALVLVACGPSKRTDPLKPPPPPDKPTATETPVPAAGQNAPHIYMSLQPNEAGALSIVFVIDAGRDNTPGDDPAIRLTPENGKCNPQDLRRFNFPADTVRRPIFGPQEVASGLTAKELPNFMAMAVTSEMLRQGLAEKVEDSKPQNVCTRKLWEQLIVNQSTRTG